MASGGGLLVILRVEVPVEEDGRVRPRQIEADAAGLGGEQKGEHVGTRSLEVFHGPEAVLRLG